MANLQLVGAVGVRVRPDTKGFREATKREVLSQLQDIEGDAKVRVDPDVEYEKANALRAFDRAFGDLEVKQKIKVKPDVDFKDLKTQLREMSEGIVGDPTGMRIAIDSSEASETLTQLARQIDDIETGLTRWPSQLELDKESYSKTFDALEHSTLEAGKAIDDYQDKLDELNRTIADSAKITDRSVSDRETALDRLSDAVQEQVDAEIEVERLRAEYHVTSGKAAKAAVSAQRKAAEELVKSRQEVVKTIRQEVKEIEARSAAAERDAAKAVSGIEKVNRQLERQNDIIEKNAETLADQREGYEKDVVQFEQMVDAETARLEVLKDQLEVERDLQNARSKSNKELQETITSLPVYEWSKYMDAVRNGLTTSKDYFDWLQKRNKDLTREQIASINEVAKRQAEAYQQAFDLAEAERKIRKDNNIDELEAIFSPKLDGRAAAAIEAKLEALARDREVKFRTANDLAQRVPVDLYIRNGKDFAADFSKAISGMGVASDLGRSLRNAAADMDVVSISAAKLSLGIGALVGTLGAGLGAASLLASDLGELSGALLMAPSLMTALGSAAFTTAKGFKDFGAAMDGDAAALATFDANGRAAARAMGALGASLEANLKPAFWRGVEDSMTSMVRTIRGPLVEGLTDTAEAMGDLFEGVFTSLENFASSGGMAEAFDGMNEGWRNAAEGAEPLIDAINTIGLAGSRHLPALGQAAADAAQKFDDWAIISERNGKMNEWIQDATGHLRSLGSITGSTVGIIASLGKAAEAAGFGGLSSLAENLRDINDQAQGSFFQGNMARIFDGTLSAVTGLSRGFGELGRAVLEQSGFIRDALEDIGAVAENTLGALADSLSNPRFLEGGAKFFNDLREASEGLGPIFDKLAAGAGDFAAVAGEVVKGALTIADSFLTVLNNSENFTAALEGLIPILTDFTATALELAHGPLTVLMDLMAGLIDVFVGLPQPIQAAAVALALLAVNAGKLKAVSLFAKDLGRAFKGADLAGGLRTMNNDITTFATNADRSSSSVHRSFARMGDGARSAGSAMGALKAGASGALGFLGGPWGLALAAAAAALLSFGQQASEQRAVIENLSGTFDEFGNATAQTADQIATTLNGMKGNWQDADLRNIWKDMLGEDGPATVGEALNKLGMTSNEVANMLLNDRDSYMQLATAMSDLGKGITPSADALQRLSSITGMSVEELKPLATYLGEAGDSMLDMAGNVDAARDSFTNLNGVSAPASQTAQDLAAAFSTMGDEASTTSDKVSALKDALDILNGGERSAVEAAIAHQEAIRASGDAAIQAVSQYGDMSNALKQVGDGFELNAATEEAAELTDIFGNLYDAALESAVGIAEAGGSLEEISAPIQQAKDQWMQLGKQMGLAPAEAQAVWDQLVGMAPEEIATTLTVEGGEAIEQASSLINTLGLEWDDRKFIAWLEADPANAELASSDAEAAARKFADEEYLAELGVESGTLDAAMREAEARGGEWDAAEFTAWLKADGTQAAIEGKSATEIARMFADQEYGAELTADAQAARSELDALNAELAAFSSGEQWQAQLNANPERFNAVLDEAKARGAEITNPDAFQAFITANADQFAEKQMTIDQVLDSWETVPHEVRVSGETGDATMKLAEIDGKLQYISTTPATARVAAEGTLAAALELGQVQVALDTVDGKTATATVTAIDQASTTIALPKAQAEQYAKQYGGTLVATDQASGIIQLPKTAAEAFMRTYNGTMTATDGASLVIQVPANKAAAYAKQYNGTLLATDGASGTIAIPQKNASAFVKDYNGNITSTDSASGTISSVQGAADGVVGDYNANMTATDNASGAIQGVIDMISRIPRYVETFINTIRGGDNAEGGIWVDSGRAFANGGIMRTMAFADGGHYTSAERNAIRKAMMNPQKESHLARHYTAKTPFRVHSEPETQGESYIPHAASKRTRSTRIWEETGNILGVNIEEYAAGGIRAGKIKGDTSSSGAGTGGGRGGVNVHVVNNYPQAEPTSTTTNRALQLAANLL